MDEKQLYKLLENSNIEYNIKNISKISDSKQLHFLAKNFNWDDDLKFIESIINNRNCALGTALMIFELAGGYDKYYSGEGNRHSGIDIVGVPFLKELEERINNNDFKNNTIEYTPDLSRVVKYKIMKQNPNINPIFIEGTKCKR